MIIDIDPEYPPSRLISYSVFEAIGQVNITHMIFHKIMPARKKQTSKTNLTDRIAVQLSSEVSTSLHKQVS